MYVYVKSNDAGRRRQGITYPGDAGIVSSGTGVFSPQWVSVDMSRLFLRLID